MTNTYTFDGVRNLDGSPLEMMPFTVTWDQTDDDELTLTAPDGSEWIARIMQDMSQPDSPRTFDGNITAIYTWTSGCTVTLNEMEDGDHSEAPGRQRAAEAVLRWIEKFGTSDFDSIERLFNRWASYAKSPYRIMEWSTRGYSQGDWWSSIVLFDSASNEEYVRGELDVYDDYLIGDVYGAELEETGDSVWGFFGQNWAENGVMEHLAGDVRSEILSRAKAKAQAEAAVRTARADAVRMVRHLVEFQKGA